MRMRDLGQQRLHNRGAGLSPVKKLSVSYREVMIRCVCNLTSSLKKRHRDEGRFLSRGMYGVLQIWLITSLLVASFSISSSIVYCTWGNKMRINLKFVVKVLLFQQIREYS